MINQQVLSGAYQVGFFFPIAFSEGGDDDDNDDENGMVERLDVVADFGAGWFTCNDQVLWAVAHPLF